MILSGTLLIQKGTKLPSSVRLKGDPGSNEWTAVNSGAELLRFRAELANAGWNYFYMGEVKQTVMGSGRERVFSAIEALTVKMRLNHCNSLQIDAITAHSLLGMAYTKVSGHCCHMQEGVIFAGGNDRLPGGNKG